MIVVACNSATTVIHKTNSLPYANDDIVEVISPIVSLVASQNKYNNIGIIGTRKTINSGMFNKAIGNLNPELNLIAKATPVLVPLIEDGFLDKKALFPVFERYFLGFEHCQLLIPACTHYPIIYEQIEAFFNHKLKVLHTPKIIAEEVERSLVAKGLLNSNKMVDDEFHLSDVTEEFVKEAELFLGKKVSFSRTLLD